VIDDLLQVEFYPILSERGRVVAIKNLTNEFRVESATVGRKVILESGVAQEHVRLVEI